MSGFSTKILKWYDSHGRDLPWRHTRDPYAIWLSEVILQQTRIEQGRDYWLRFMERFPRVDLLANASEDEVLRLWQGLGYYSRARHLYCAAQQIVAQGAFPTTYEAIRALKGVGDYTAAAIASLAFDQAVAVVDGNVYRVLARHYGIFTPINSTEGKKEFVALAQALLPPSKAARYNQAIMDFGATCCTPKSPKCEQCPLAETCIALREGVIGSLPVKEKKISIKERHMNLVWLRAGNEVALRRRPAGDIWQGLWEPLTPSDINSLPSTPVLLQKDVKHVLTHRIIFANFFLLECAEKPELPNGYIWIKESDLDDYALPRLVEHLVAAVHRASSHPAS